MFKNNIHSHKDIAINIITTTIVAPNYLNCELRVHEGSLNETKKQRGFAHFVEHLIFNNTIDGNIRCVDAIKNNLCDYNAYTAHDHTSFYTEGTINNCYIAFNALIQSFVKFNKSTLSDKEFDNEKNIVLNEIDGYSTSSDDYIACSEIREKIYNMPEVIGLRSVIEKVSKKAIVDYHNKTNLNKRSLQFILICNPIQEKAVLKYIKGIIDVHLSELQPLLRRNLSAKKLYTNIDKVKSETPKIEIFKPSIMNNPDVTYLAAIFHSKAFSNYKDYIIFSYVCRYITHIMHTAIRDDAQSYGISLYELGMPSTSKDVVIGLFTQPNSVESSDYFISLMNYLDDLITEKSINEFLSIEELSQMKGFRLRDISGLIDVAICYGITYETSLVEILEYIREYMTVDNVKALYNKHFKNDMLRKITWRIISGK